MNVDTFITQYKKLPEKDRDAFIEKHIKTKYIPWEMKEVLVQNIHNISMYKEVNGKRIIWQNSPVEYYLTTLTMLEQYTDIELGEDKQRLADFNRLNELSWVCGDTVGNVIDAIRMFIGRDWEEFETVRAMHKDDIYANERSLIGYIDTKLEAMGMVSETIQKAFEQAVESNATFEGSEANE